MKENFKSKPIMRKRIVSSEDSITSKNETSNEGNLPAESDAQLNESDSLTEKLEKIGLPGFVDQEKKAGNTRSSKYRLDTTSYLIDLFLEKASSGNEWFIMLETNRELRTKHGLKNSQISGHLYAKLNQGFVENRDLSEEERAVFAEEGISPGNLKAWRVTEDFKERMKLIREQIKEDAANEVTTSQPFATDSSDVKEGEFNEETNNDE